MAKRSRFVTVEEVALPAPAPTPKKKAKEKEEEEEAPPPPPPPSKKKTPSLSVEALVEGALKFVTFQGYYDCNAIDPISPDDHPEVAADKRVLLDAQKAYTDFTAQLRAKWTLNALTCLPADLRDVFKKHNDLNSLSMDEKMAIGGVEVACSHSGAVAAVHVVLHCVDYMKALATEQHAPQQESFVALWSFLTNQPAFQMGHQAILNAILAAEREWGVKK
jgi:hypothetical protein